jgi:hypothetical protein
VEAKLLVEPQVGKRLVDKLQEVNKLPRNDE